MFNVFDDNIVIHAYRWEKIVLIPGISPLRGQIWLPRAQQGNTAKNFYGIQIVRRTLKYFVIGKTARKIEIESAINETSEHAIASNTAD